MPLPKVRVGPAVFHEHTAPRWGHGVGDVFAIHVPSCTGIPPWLLGNVLREAGKVLYQLRNGACIWLKVPPVDETGRWWRTMLTRSIGPVPVPVAVGESLPPLGKFSFAPRVLSSPLPAGKLADTYPALSSQEETILTVLARIHKGYTAEIASLALVSIPTARKSLENLKEKQLISRETNRWPYWVITRKGVSLALRTWGVPKGALFRVRKERRTHTAYRHRRISRLWNAWLKKAGYTVLGGWSEVILPRMKGFAPDALSWGDVNGNETLFWLEVSSGHSSRTEIAIQAKKRLMVAQGFARLHKVHLVFTVLGVPWAVKAAAKGMTDIAPFAAVLMEDWNNFGSLPKVRWGSMQKKTSLTR